MEPCGHRPVLSSELLSLVSPIGNGLIIDCTLGLGGHAELLMSQAGQEAQLVGLDVDERNLLSAKSRLIKYEGRARFFHANFSELDEVMSQAQLSSAELILADLGVCSVQLDDPDRGLSFCADGPLDMRLDNRIRCTAAALVNNLDEKALADLIFKFGQERYSRRIASAIVHARRSESIRTTLRLAKVVESAIPAAVRAARRGAHPATRTFQALRIAVNQELDCLDRLLSLLPKFLAVGGKAAIISFHSLEDGAVKHAFNEWAATGQAKVLTKKPITAGEQEMMENPRSRSAKLRVVQRIS